MQKVHIWMNFPSHHQSGFFNSLIAAGVELQVTYYDQITRERIALGWGNEGKLAPWECSLSLQGITAIQRLEATADHIQVIPGYGCKLLREIRDAACRQGLAWCHWSEASRNGLRWYARVFTKRRHAALINRHAIGAFAQGMLARIDFLRWGVRADKIADLAYSVDLASDDTVPDETISEFANGRGVFLFVGRADHAKALDVQLRAFALASRNTDRWCMAVVGGGKQEQYQEQARCLGVQDRVLFVPAVPWSRVAGVYRAGNVLLLPSRYEGWGAVVNEGCHYGLAIISSPASGAAWHLVQPGINGFWADPGDADSLAAAMQRYVCGGVALAERHGARSRALVADYTCQAMATRFLNVIDSWTANAAGDSGND